MKTDKWKEKIEELEDQNKQIYRTSIFLFKMLIAGFFFHLILFLYPNTYGLQSSLAHITQIILNSVGVELQRQGALLLDSQNAYLVTQDCLGWKSMTAFTALIFASTNNYREHLKPLLAGLGAIMLVNIFRISTTVYFSHTNLISFNIIHSLFWKWGLTFTIILLWLAWLRNNLEKVRN